MSSRTVRDPEFGVLVRALQMGYRWWPEMSLFVRIRPVWPTIELLKSFELRSMQRVNRWIVELVAPRLELLQHNSNECFVMADNVGAVMRHVSLPSDMIEAARKAAISFEVDEQGQITAQ